MANIMDAIQVFVADFFITYFVQYLSCVAEITWGLISEITKLNFCTNSLPGPEVFPIKAVLHKESKLKTCFGDIYLTKKEN